MDIYRAVHSFLHHAAHVRKLSPHTVRAYTLDLLRFASVVGGAFSVSSCDRGTLHAYVTTLFETYSLKSSSVKRHVASLRALFRWLEQEGVVADDPFRRVSIRIRQPKRLPRVLTRAELRAMLRNTGEDTFADVTARVASEVLFATGIRVAELTGLVVSDVDVENGVVSIIGKGNRQRRVYLPDEAIVLVREYAALRATLGMASHAFLVNSRGEPASPQYVRRLIRRRADAACVGRRVTPHMFRHSLATYLLEEGVDLRYIQRLLGHRSISTTEVYTYVADAQLKSVVTARHPRRRLLPA